MREQCPKNLQWAAKFVDAMSLLTTFFVKRAIDGPLKGYTIIISGTLPGYTRKQAQQAVEEAGGENSNSVKKPKPGLKQIVIVVGPPTTSKAKKAQKYGIKIYNKEDFFKILHNGLS